MSATHLLVGNPTAQSGQNAARIARALDLLAEGGVSARLLSTEPAGATVGLVRRALDADPSLSVVIAMGGDGTFREVAAGLYTSGARERVALAMLPTGTANDQGKSFGLDAAPTALAANVAVVRAGREARLDVGVYRAGGGAADYFFDSAGWGLSARVLAQRNEDRAFVQKIPLLDALYRDHAVYAGALMKTFLASYVVDDKLRVEAVLDGEAMVLDGLTDLVVKNTRYYGGAWIFDRTSRPDDGAFELIPFRGRRDWASKAIVDLDGNPITEELLNRIGVEHSRPLRARRFSLRLAAPPGGAPLAAQLDGEEWPAHPEVEIEVAARALRLIVPAEHAA